MKNFWGLIKGDKYDLGTTGGSVCVMDKEGAELAVIKGLSHANEAAFVPGGKRFLVKSADGYVSVYDLGDFSRFKKFRFSNRASQDYGFCFSPDGSLFYIIDNYNGLNTRIAVYETEGFTEVDSLLGAENEKFLTRMECFHSKVVALGYMRNFGVISCGFVGILEEDGLRNIKRISLNDFYYADRYKALEALGFTPKALKWLPLPEDRQLHEFSLIDMIF